MSIEGTYVPSATQWVRDNVELYESTNGEQGNTL
ncbi:MAG: nitroreductase family deazaflavin-dependent oxidoreductase, partial [Myxococcales bacterium]